MKPWTVSCFISFLLPASGVFTRRCSIGWNRPEQIFSGFWSSVLMLLSFDKWVLLKCAVLYPAVWLKLHNDHCSIIIRGLILQILNCVPNMGIQMPDFDVAFTGLSLSWNTGHAVTIHTDEGKFSCYGRCWLLLIVYLKVAVRKGHWTRDFISHF